MEGGRYKIRLQGGRVLGPLDLRRIHVFIFRGKITGLEEACQYPKGEWKDINRFPEIASLLLRKLENKLESPAAEMSSVEDLEREIEGAPIEIGTHTSDQPPPFLAGDDKTMVAAPDEKTIIQQRPKTHLIQVENQENAARPRSSLASEQTQMLELPKAKPIAKAPAQGASGARKNAIALLKDKKKLAFFLISALLLLFIVFAPQEKAAKKAAPPFKVEMPVIREKPDPQKSADLYARALPFYNQDTVDGYKAAAKFLLEAVANDPNNVKAMCLLASSYMHLIDVVDRDENYFTIVTRLIEQERAKGVNLPETVVADVELYLILGNPDAAISRIVDYTKNRQFGVEMFYYLALSFYSKGMLPDASKYLNNIDPKDYFSPRIPHLYGLIYSKSKQTEDAIRSFQQVIEKSPRHAKARVSLAELLFKKDSYESAIEQASYVIANPDAASRDELAQAHYFRARSRAALDRLIEAHADLARAHALSPDDQDILLEYYTLKARVGERVGEAASRAQMFNYVAIGEKALQEGRLREAKMEFLKARNVRNDDPVPLLRLAEVFKRTGEAAEARSAYEKAVKLGSVSSRVDFYPKYIQALIDAYEFEEAQRQVEIFKGLSPPSYVVDKIYGDFYSRQDKLREAQSYYKRALSGTNVDSSVYNAYAKIMYKGGDFRQAAFYSGLARRFDPFNVDGTIGIGKALAELEGVDKGVAYISAELANNPNKAALFNGISEIYVRKGDYEAALKTAGNALAIDPKFALIHKTRGEAFAAQEKFREALEEYQIYADEVPLDPAGYVERYKIFMRKLAFKQAKEEIEKVIRNYPKYPGALYMLGELYNQAQNWNGAMQAADQEIANNPHYVPAYVLAGSVLNTNREYAKALEYLNRALRIDPNYVPGLIQTGFANQMLKTYAAAKSMYERALAQDPGNPKIHKYLGVLHFELGDRKKAAEFLKNYIDLYPDAPDHDEVKQKIQNM